MNSNVYYEQREVWDKNLQENPFYLDKLQIMMAMIPRSTKTILDLGCGDGSITNTLGKRYSTVGADYSLKALERVDVDRICCKSNYLPVKDEAFDLVFSSELLEHLEGFALIKTVREIKRVAKKHILISVPFKEYLNKRNMQCPNCKHIFHVWGHRRAFNISTIQELFRDYELKAWCHCGPYEYNPNKVLLALRQYLGSDWFYEPNENAICPACGNKEFVNSRKGITAKYLEYMERNILEPKKCRYPYWIVVLLGRIA